MAGQTKLYMDQYGNHWYARTVAELKRKVGGGKVSPMYVDRGSKTYMVGYVVGQHWCSAFVPYEKAA